MAVNITIRSLLRGSPPVRIGLHTLSTTAGTVVDVTDPVVRKDLHRNLGQWVITNAGNSAPVSAGASTDPTAIDTQTSGGAVSAIDTQTGASTSAITASSNDADGAKLSLTQALQVDYNKTVEDVTDLYDTVGTLVTDYTKAVEDIQDLYATVASLVTVVTALNEALEDNGIFSS